MIRVYGTSNELQNDVGRGMLGGQTRAHITCCPGGFRLGTLGHSYLPVSYLDLLGNELGR